MDKQVTVSARALLMTVLVAVALVAAYLIGRAGPAPANAATTDTTSTVTVTGLGSVSVVPDQLAFDLGVSVVRPDLDQAIDDANSSMQSVVDTLKTAGVADKDVQTTDLSMNPEYSHKKGEKPVLTGYRVSHSVTVTVEELGKASGIVTAALDAGGAGVRLNGLRLQVADPDGSLQPARTKAMDQAKAKAEEYAADAGRELGAVVRISEVPDQSYDQQMGYLDSARGAAAASAAFPIQAGQQELTANVTVVYELK